MKIYYSLIAICLPIGLSGCSSAQPVDQAREIRNVDIVLDADLDPQTAFERLKLAAFRHCSTPGEVTTPARAADRRRCQAEMVADGVEQLSDPEVRKIWEAGQ